MPSQTQNRQLPTRRLHILQRLSLAAAIALLANAAGHLVLYIQYPDWWQLLAGTVSTLAEAGAAFMAHRVFREGRIQAGYRWLWPVFILLSAGRTLAGPDIFTLVTATLGVLLLALMVWPAQWARWLTATLGYAAGSSALMLLSPAYALSRQQAAVLAPLDTLTAVFIGLLLLYEVIRWLPNINIRSRLLVWSLGGITLPILLVAGLSIYFALSGGQRQVVNQLTSLAQLKKNQISLWEEHLQSLLGALTSDPQAAARYQHLLRASDQARQAAALLQVDQQFRQYTSNTPYFEELFLLDANGEVVYSTNPARQGQIFRNTTFFQQSLHGPTTQPPVYDSTRRESVIIISRPIRNGEEESIGIIAGLANLQVLDDIMQEREGLGKTGETYLVGLNHALLTTAREADTAFGGAYIDTEGVRLGMETKSLGNARYLNYADKEVLGVYTWVPELQSVLIAERQASDAFNEIYLGLLFLGSASLLSGLAAAVATLFVARGISEPLNELAQTAGRIAAGDIEAQAPVRNNDEIAALAAAFNVMTTRLRSLIGTLEERVARRTEEIEARSRRVETVAQIGSAIATIRDVDVLLKRITRLISRRLGYYHVGIFLLDENSKYAILRAANSAGGQRMLARGHRLRVGETGIVGYVTAYRKPRVALNVGEDAVYFDNPDLPETRSEAAIPLISGRALLGALDVQSTEPNAFTKEDIHILQLLADQLATAIENAHLFTQTQQALEEAQRAYGELSQQAWLHLLEEGILSGGYRSGKQGEDPLKSSNPLPPLSRQAIREKAFVQQTDGDVQRVAIPLQIRGTIIGVVETHKPRQAGRWSPEELDTLQNIVVELGDALESARLYTETSLRAENERHLAEIATQVRASLNTEDILQTAVRHIQQAFALAEVEIRMEAPDKE